MFVVTSSVNRSGKFTCRIAKMFILFLIHESDQCRRGLGFNLQSPQLLKKERKKTRKALTLDAIFFKDVIFLKCWLL